MHLVFKFVGRYLRDHCFCSVAIDHLSNMDLIQCPNIVNIFRKILNSINIQSLIFSFRTMTETKIPSGFLPGQSLAKPLHLQRLESSLDMRPFMNYAQSVLSQRLTSSESSDSDSDNETVNPGDKYYNGIKTSKIGLL